MATYEYGQSSRDKKFYFKLIEGNNKTILASTEQYETEQACLKGINSVKANAHADSNYRRFIGSDDQYYFTLRAAGNYEPIGKSEGYPSEYNRDRGLENCKKDAPTAGTKKITPYV